jgi:hypothetical protein
MSLKNQLIDGSAPRDPSYTVANVANVANVGWVKRQRTHQ